ncbi:MAG TPA: sigma-70 factor domain-containing protein, partial [Geodermatophilus sp.]|nr:sigma-70 factor domain-containing protein [Geodermatophilus sp.]
MPADQPAPEAAAASTSSRSRTAAPAGKAPARKKAPAKSPTGQNARPKPSITPSPGTGEGAVLTAVASEDSAVAVIDAGTEGLKLDETVVAGPDGVADEPAVDEADAADFEWDDEEESEALRQARKDAELTASADSVRAYLKQIGKVALLNAEE